MTLITVYWEHKYKKTDVQEMYLLELVITRKFWRNGTHDVDQSVTHTQWRIWGFGGAGRI